MRVRILLNPYAGFPHQELFFLMQQLYWLCLHPSLLWAPQREKNHSLSRFEGTFDIFGGAKGGRGSPQFPMENKLKFELCTATSW